MGARMSQTTRRSILKFTLLTAFATGALAVSKTRPALSSERALLPGPKFFVKGIYQQPVENMAVWKGRGVNTIFTMNRGADLGEWTSEATTRGLHIVREPAGISEDYVIVDRAAFDKDIANPNLLALALMDEPSNLKPGSAGITYDGVAVPPEEVDTVARGWSAAGKPLWINHVGNHINNIYLEAIMGDYADSPYIDWVSHDCYPIAGGSELIIDLDDYTSTPQGHAIDRLSIWSDGRPQFSFVGLTQYDGSLGRKTKPGEFRVQAWSSVIHGAVGIIYFSFKFSPEFSYDATPLDLQKELRVFHSQIDSIEDILMDKQKGGRRASTVMQSIRGGNAESGTSLPYPFEASSTRTEEGEYKIILNLSDEAAELSYAPWGLSKVRFEAYQCKRGYLPADFSQA